MELYEYLPYGKHYDDEENDHVLIFIASGLAGGIHGCTDMAASAPALPQILACTSQSFRLPHCDTSELVV